MIPYLRLPKEPGVVIRGELIIKKSVFQDKYSKEFSNPRNFVAGVVNQKTPPADRLRTISFVAYELIQPIAKPSEQLKMLGSMNVETVRYAMMRTMSSELLSNTLDSWRTDSVYEMDGLICCNDNIYSRRSGNPEHAFAFKTASSDNTIDAVVVAVLWSASKDGYLKPRIQFEPIMLGGVRIEYATGFNGKFIVDNNIGAGAIVTIIRSGDVIPHIVHVGTQAKEPSMPTDEYVWNDTGIDIMLADKMNDVEVNHKVITLFFKTIGVEGLGSGNVKKIIDAGYNTIQQIISMTREQYLYIPGFKQKMSDKIYDGIKAKMNEASLPLLMDATNIFGRGFGEKKFQAILADLPDIIVSADSVSTKIALVEKVNGIAFKTAQRFVENLQTFIAWATDVGIESKLFAKPLIKHPASKQHPLYGKKIVITGFRDKELVAAFERVGAINANNVSKDVCLVIIKEHGVDTSKTEFANASGIPLMTLSAFKKKFAFD
jgi:DNA ligase (NAD+)